MSLQSQPDVNTLLHNMCAQVLVLTRQLAELQANPTAAAPSIEKKFNKKVEVVTDPRTFEGDRAQFAEWWIKLQIWLLRSDQDIAVLSRLKGPVVGQYTQVRMQECYTAGVWPTWDNLKVEIKKYFKPQAERDWARQQICSFKQGNMRMDDFVTWFLALSIQGGLEQLYLQDMRSDNLSQAAEEVRKIGRVIELYKMHQGGGTTTKNNYSQRSPGLSNQHKNYSHGADKSTDSPASAVGRRGTWPKIVQTEHGPLNKKNNQGCQARQLETEKPDDRLQTLTGHSYNEIRAFFYDQQVNEMKAQGKEFGA
ncbi:hypothetical protein SERLA73DRAFT_80186 [Serpula lacrymans var. lacrymans S7.3]|uniref:Uncharacterized protein n=1 Tax=Serpula lacrymans var. lacrymans (strain S7.3) TaxID=936435 RepID=F8QIZ8_SERL3|nr:hypothetical protein SERLA73DRAFT_80186 [Serpula lacrymans var. lacrymans S7.3]